MAGNEKLLLNQLHFLQHSHLTRYHILLKLRSFHKTSQKILKSAHDLFFQHFPDPAVSDDDSKGT